LQPEPEIILATNMTDLASAPDESIVFSLAVRRSVQMLGALSDQS
jgi:hypothetical protein